MLTLSARLLKIVGRQELKHVQTTLKSNVHRMFSSAADMPSGSGSYNSASISSSGAFTASLLDAISATIASQPHGRFSVTKSLADDLHLQKTDRLRKMRCASVFIPLCNRNGKACILYTLRTQQVSTHKGQVSFPGGMMDPGETVEQAAVRETMEEIGLPGGADGVRIIGLGQTIFSITGVLVTPVLGFIKDDIGDLKQFTPSVHEVEEIFSRSVDRLNSPGFKTFETYTRDGKSLSVPVFDDSRDIKEASVGDLSTMTSPSGELVTLRKRRIWGLTALLTEATLRIINDEMSLGKLK